MDIYGAKVREGKVVQIFNDMGPLMDGLLATRVLSFEEKRFWVIPVRYKNQKDQEDFNNSLKVALERAYRECDSCPGGDIVLFAETKDIATATDFVYYMIAVFQIIPHENS